MDQTDEFAASLLIDRQTAREERRGLLDTTQHTTRNAKSPDVSSRDLAFKVRQLGRQTATGLLLFPDTFTVTEDMSIRNHLHNSKRTLI